MLTIQKTPLKNFELWMTSLYLQTFMYHMNATNVLAQVPSVLPRKPNAVREWCINAAAIDPATSSALCGAEDGILYRWHFPTNSFTQSVVLTKGVGEAYTPTITGPTGIVYAINNATLFACGQATP